jgi:hypothetical protein
VCQQANAVRTPDALNPSYQRLPPYKANWLGLVG